MFDSYPEYEYLFAQLQLVLFMLGMGATLTTADFAQVIYRPRFLLLGLGFLFLVTPLLAVLIITVGRLESGIAVGLVLISAMPGGSMSKLFSYLGGGNIALSITLTFSATVMSLVTVPLLMRLLAFRYLPADFQIPLTWWVMRDVALYLLLPLGIGMAVARYAPVRRQAFSRWCIRIGMLFVIAMVVGSLGSGRIKPWEYGWQVPLAIVLFCVGGMQAVMIPARLLRWPVPDRLVIGIEVTMRNMNLALLLKALLFPARKGDDPIGDGVLFVVLYYAAVAMVAAVPLTLNHRRLLRRAPAPQIPISDAPGITLPTTKEGKGATSIPGDALS